MKEIKAYLRPDRVKKVVDALIKKGLLDIAINTVEKIGVGKDSKHLRMSLITHKLFSRTIKLEAICTDEEAPQLVKLIQKKGHTGLEGDGVIFVVDVSEVINVRTGTNGEKTLAKV